MIDFIFRIFSSPLTFSDFLLFIVSFDFWLDFRFKTFVEKLKEEKTND